ncbi:MAG: hypothetical protein BGO69_09020 [Bacteroidetes bacterium 46-16]|nr:MAG: hypothetical protein BGO69_09020 [Bacteroidetes bacterium 46-16]
MKRILLSATSVLALFTACNNNSSEKTAESTTVKDSSVTSSSAATVPVAASSIKGIIDGYLHLKNALATDDGNAAATAGSDILTAMQSVDMNQMDEAKHKAYMSVADDIKENAEHINANAGKIAHQREHFEMLSKDIYDLVKAFGAGTTLYKDFCPMAFDQKGAFWLSETKDIKNPYFGKEMPECGEVKEELK